MGFLGVPDPLTSICSVHRWERSCGSTGLVAASQFPASLLGCGLSAGWGSTIIILMF